jgi:hypothetical protein
VAETVHELKLNHHEVTRTEATKGYLRLETRWLNARGLVQLLMESWRPDTLDWYAGELVGDTIKRAVHDDAGNLTIEFESGKSLECPPHPKYESWDVNIRPGPVRFSLPGGGWDGFEGHR